MNFFEIGEKFLVKDRGNDLVLSSSQMQKINTLFDAEKKNNPSLFDEPLFQVLAINSDKIEGRFIPYRVYLATTLDPTLSEDLSLTVLGVTGVTTNEKKILLAKRGPHVTRFSSQWECAPSGGLSQKFLQKNRTVDYRAELMDEMEEELGLPQEKIESMRPLFLIEDLSEKVVDLVLKLTLRESSGIAVQGEYTDFKWVSFQEIVLSELTPLSQHILQHLRTYGS